MNANELRLGNYLYNYMILDNGMGKISQEIISTKPITIEDLVLIEKYSFATYMPIPLTPKLLLKCNFIKDNYGIFYITKDGTNTSSSEITYFIKKCKPKKKWVYEISVGDLGNTNSICYINYLHQLQNTHFVLAGTELTVNI